MKIKLSIITITFLVLSSAASLSAQTLNRVDTLQAAVKTDRYRVIESIGNLETNLDGIRSVASPLGEGDPIRWVQGLPGVTTGADGSSAIYVRGGNFGNNLFSVDGVQIYGYTHLLGLTTTLPQDVVGNVSLSKSGFGGSDSNFTSSHISIETKTPGGEGPKLNAAINNFLVSAAADIPITSKLSFLFSGRISPLTYEYRAVKGLLPNMLGDLNDFKAGVGDIYGKLHWQISGRHSLELSGLGSMDRYSFVTPSKSDEAMGWNNGIALLRYRGEFRRSSLDVGLSYNSYGNNQEQETLFRGVLNHLTLRSTLNEAKLSIERKAHPQKYFGLDFGANFRYAVFAPGQVAAVSNRSESILGVAYLQGNFIIPDILTAKLVVKGNFYRNTKYDKNIITPDYNISAKWNIGKHVALEASYDKMTQFYHTLEGLPVGWSLDMIVPSGEKVLPESAQQANLGILLSFSRHTLTIGAYGKKMDNLVYYKDASTMFSGSLAAWEDNVDIGQGTSYGTELLYEYNGDQLYTKVAYTLSKTTREGFANVNEGRPFHARFDRRHVFNAMAQWQRFSLSFTAQSGHWENGAAETYTMHIPGTEWTADYFAGVNNYHMPTVIRLDVGYDFSFHTRKLQHNIHLGICNVLNRFNPFMLYFDSSTESWKELALLPILPNFSYRISF